MKYVAAILIGVLAVLALLSFVLNQQLSTL
jgi:hypothetical protein